MEEKSATSYGEGVGGGGVCRGEGGGEEGGGWEEGEEEHETCDELCDGFPTNK